MKQITSPQNFEIKNLVTLLEKSRDRKNHNLFVIEGRRETRLALKSGYKVHKVFFCPDFITPGEWEKFLSELKPETEAIEISSLVFKKLAYREDSGGVIALAEPKDLSLTAVVLPEKPLIVVLETVEKPGNLGAILRTCDAAGVDAVIVCDPQTDIYNPNVIRSGIGTLFTNQVAVCSSTEAIQWLKKNQIAIFVTWLETNHYYDLEDYKKPSALVFGSEAYGISECWLKAADRHIKIPMSGQIDSLNVSTSAAILIFEAKRQRSFMS